MSQKYEIVVELKREVLDAEGRAIRDVLLRSGGAHSVEDVMVSKRFVLTVSENEPAAYVENLAREFLANPVAEIFRVTRL